MEYKVKITPFALSQLHETVNYIAQVLLVPETALKWLDVLESEIKELGNMPTKYELTQEEPWHSRGIRKKVVKGFCVYHLITDNAKTVWVTAVVCGKRNQIDALKEMDRH